MIADLHSPSIASWGARASNHFLNFASLLTVSEIMPPTLLWEVCWGEQRIQRFPGLFSLAREVVQGLRFMVSKCHTSQTPHYSLLFLSFPFSFRVFFPVSSQTCKQHYLDSEATHGKLKWYSVSQPTMILFLYPQLLLRPILSAKELWWSSELIYFVLVQLCLRCPVIGTYRSLLWVVLHNEWILWDIRNLINVSLFSFFFVYSLYIYRCFALCRDSILLLLLLSLNILHVEIKELPYVLRLITTNSPKNLLNLTT